MYRCQRWPVNWPGPHLGNIRRTLSKKNDWSRINCRDHMQYWLRGRAHLSMLVVPSSSHLLQAQTKLLLAYASELPWDMSGVLPEFCPQTLQQNDSIQHCFELLLVPGHLHQACNVRIEQSFSHSCQFLITLTRLQSPVLCTHLAILLEALKILLVSCCRAKSCSGRQPSWVWIRLKRTVVPLSIKCTSAN